MSDPSITRFPSPINKEALNRPSEEKKALIEKKMEEIMEILGLDLTDPSLQKTPFRIAKMFVDEIFSGLDSKNFPSITLYDHRASEEEMVLVKNILFISFCEHHFVPFVGRAHIAYLPGKKIIGLSKINRVVHYFAKRPQVQERLTAQIADSLSSLLNTDDIAVSISAKHFCVVARGVEDTESETETQVLKGKFHTELNRREEFFRSIHEQRANPHPL